MLESTFDINQKRSIYLDVPHVWQEDPDYNIPENERRSVCSIACMKMILDFLKPQTINTLTIDQIFQTIKNYGRSNDEKFRFGYHPYQVDFFKTQGLLSWRRNWYAPSSDTSWFVQNEGYDDTQLQAVNTQMQYEDFLQESNYSTDDIVTTSLVSSMRLGNPVIVSVKPGFSSNKIDHQIVINGYYHTGTHNYFYYLDPLLSPEKNLTKQTISVENFFKYSRYLAIFVALN